MIRLFVDRDAYSELAQRESCKNEEKRRNWIVDMVFIPRTQVVTFDTQTKLYTVKESTRDDKGDWKNSENGIAINDASIEYTDNISGLLEIIFDDKTKHKSIIMGLLLARQAENFLSEIGFWDINEIPDIESGGVLITSENEKLIAKVVYGKDRPDMMCVPYRLHLRDIGYVLEPEEPVMGRPYYDEFMDSLLGRN